jgi:hypothetical protein
MLNPSPRSDFFTSLMAAGIIFIVIIQRRIQIDALKTFIFEGVKSVLATGLWLWLLLDTLFGPWQSGYSNRPDIIDERKAQRLARTITSAMLLL